MVEISEVSLPDGRTLQVFDTGGTGAPLLWHHGSPHTRALLTPLLAAASGHRVIAYARPSYGTSTPTPGRDVASAAADSAAVLDALALDRVATLGYSGGGPHALACAALLAERISAVVTF